MSYFGPRRIRGKRTSEGKIPVVGLLKRNGKVYTSVIKNCGDVVPIIQGRSRGTIYMMDGKVTIV